MDRIGPRDFQLVFLNRPANEPRFGRLRGIVLERSAGWRVRVHLQQVGRPIEIAHRLYTARLIELVANVELLHTAAGAQQCDEVAARRATPCAEVVAVEFVLRGVCTQPADGRFAILNLGRENRLATQPVADARDGIAALQLSDGPDLLLASRRPTAAVNPDDERQRPIRFLRQIKIQQQSLFANARIFQIALDLDARRHLRLLSRSLRLLGRRFNRQTKSKHLHYAPNPNSAKVRWHGRLLAGDLIQYVCVSS